MFEIAGYDQCFENRTWNRPMTQSGDNPVEPGTDSQSGLSTGPFFKTLVMINSCVSEHAKLK